MFDSLSAYLKSISHCTECEPQTAVWDLIVYDMQSGCGELPCAVMIFNVRNSKIEVVWVMKQRKQNIQAPKRAVALTGDERQTQKNKAIASVVNKIKY